MGDWSFEPWGTDEAADWFAVFWRTPDVTLVVDEIERFDPAAERYEALRAAAYVLASFGSPYTWPDPHLDKLKPLLALAIDLLSKMIAPPDERWGFLDAWCDDPRAARAVEEQITALQARLDVLA